MKKVDNELTHPKQRTSQQNKAMWLWFEILAKELNNAGLDMRIVLKPTYKIDWTKENIHDHLWLPIQKVLYGTESTTFLKKQEQIEHIYEIIMRELGEKHGLENIPFPVDMQRAYEKYNYGTYQS